MRRELSQTDEERLFIGAVDGALAEDDAKLIAEDPELRARLAKYRHAIEALKDEPHEKAPDGLATLILARTKKKRFSLKYRDAGLWQAVPAEIIIPLIIAALVAAFLFVSTP
jgi:hypothetical protein